MFQIGSVVRKHIRPLVIDADAATHKPIAPRPAGPGRTLASDSNGRRAMADLYRRFRTLDGPCD